MNKYHYYGVAVKQTPFSEPFFLISVNANQLLEWSSVPRKKENFLAGYQRQLDDRHEKLTEYLTQSDADGKNIIPSSVIVAVDKNNIRVEQTSINDIFKIEIISEDKDINQILKETVVNLKARLGREELDSIQAEYGEQSDNSDEEDEANEEVPPDSYMAMIVKILEKANGDINNLSEGIRSDVDDYLNGVSKPGLVLDGQHRLYGAKNVSAFPVALPVVLLPGLGFAEQVFHFYVLNNKAKPLNKTELRSVISTSLSNQEIKKLYDRFRQVNVIAEETGWTHDMDNNPESPFKGLINFGHGNKNKPIPENVAYQVVSKFIKLKVKYKPLYKDVSEWGATVEEGHKYRLKVFYALWRSVKNRYPNAWNSAVTNGGGQILQKVNFLVLQEYLLDKFIVVMTRRTYENKPSPFSDPDDLSREVGIELSPLLEDFFIKEWKIKGLDTGPGHKTFREELEKVISNQSQNLGNIRLFKETQR